MAEEVPNPVEQAEKLAAKLVAEGMAEFAARTLAEAWAFSRLAATSLSQIADMMGPMMRGEVSLGGLLTGRRRRKRGGEAVLEAGPPSFDGQAPLRDPRHPEPLTPVHSHGQGWDHAHLGGERAHDHPGLSVEDWQGASAVTGDMVEESIADLDRELEG